jgi:EamA domain-containing membrane protein RarD
MCPMKSLIAIVAVLTAAPALAHTGHVVEAAGHNHWIAVAAAGLAAAVALWAVAKGRRKDEVEAEEAEAEEEAQEA